MTQYRFLFTSLCAAHASCISSFNPPRTLGVCIIIPIFWQGNTHGDLNYLKPHSFLAVEPGFKVRSVCLHGPGILKEVWGNHPRLSIFSSDCFAQARHAVSMPPLNIYYNSAGAEHMSPAALCCHGSCSSSRPPQHTSPLSLQWSLYFKLSLTALHMRSRILGPAHFVSRRASVSGGIFSPS